ARAETLSAAVRDIGSLLHERGFEPASRGESLTYQDSCHLRHGLKVWREPRELLRRSGRYRELPSADQCCGSAGVYNLLRPDIAGRILASKVREAEALGVEEIVTSNPGC